MKKKIGLFMVMVLILTAAQSQSQSLGERLPGMERFQGYFPFYWDADTGKIWLEIEKFDVDFLYVSSLAAGLGSNDIGLDRSQLGGTRVVRFERIGPKVLLVQPNFSFRASSQSSAERKAVDDGFAKSVIWGFQVADVVAGRVIVDATSFFMQDAHGVTGSLQRTQASYRLDLSRSAFY